MHGMIGKQIQNEFAVAKAHNGEDAFTDKWGGNPGLARETGGNLVMSLTDRVVPLPPPTPRTLCI